MKKICPTCNIEKEIGEFYTRKNGKVYTYCRLCAKEKRNKWNVDNPQKYKENIHKAFIAKKEFMSKINDIKTSSGCIYCRYNKHPECLQFHHIESSEKENGISEMIRLWHIDGILEEINKCIVLCANCHMALHNGDIKL